MGVESSYYHLFWQGKNTEANGIDGRIDCTGILQDSSLYIHAREAEASPLSSSTPDGDTPGKASDAFLEEQDD